VAVAYKLGGLHKTLSLDVTTGKCGAATANNGLLRQTAAVIKQKKIQNYSKVQAKTEVLKYNSKKIGKKNS